MIGEAFTCALCHGTFRKKWSEPEAEAEYLARFPGGEAVHGPRVTVCDDCDRELRAREAMWRRVNAPWRDLRS